MSYMNPTFICNSVIPQVKLQKMTPNWPDLDTNDGQKIITKTASVLKLSGFDRASLNLCILLWENVTTSLPSRAVLVFFVGE